MWLFYLKLILKVSQPAIFLLGLISFKRNWKDFISNPIVRMFCIFIAIDLVVKYNKLFSTDAMSIRYMYPIAIAFIVFAGDGLLKLIQFLHGKLEKKIPYFTCKKFTIIMFIAILGIFLVKILVPETDSPWFKGVGCIIKKESPKGIKPVILTNAFDPRLGYYSNANLFTLSVKNFKISDKSLLYSKQYSKLNAKQTPGIENLYANIKKLGRKNVFLLLFDMPDTKFRKYFTVKHLKFPFRLLKVYHKQEMQICFYQFEG